MNLVDVTKPHIPCWLVWVTSENGLVTLMAIALTQKISDQYRDLLGKSGKYVRVKIEKTEANHLFVGSLDELWWEMYGTDAMERIEDDLLDFARKERDATVNAGCELWDAIAEYMNGGSKRELAEVMSKTRPHFVDEQ